MSATLKERIEHRRPTLKRALQREEIIDPAVLSAEYIEGGCGLILVCLRRVQINADSDNRFWFARAEHVS